MIRRPAACLLAAVLALTLLPGAALAVVTGDRLVLHDGSGVTPLDYAEVAAETSVSVIVCAYTVMWAGGCLKSILHWRDKIA